MRVCINDCKKGHKPDCETTETHRNCEPVEATRGLVCEKCYTELRDALSLASGIVFHLRSIYGILRSRSSDGSQKVKREPPAPLNLSALELSDDIYKVLLGRTIRTGALATVTAAEVDAKAHEILSVFDVAVNQESVKQLTTLVKFVRTAMKAYPLEEQIRVTAMPCPQCDLKTIFTPPQQFGEDIKVSCEACGFIVPPDKVAFYAHLAEKNL